MNIRLVTQMPFKMPFLLKLYVSIGLICTESKVFSAMAGKVHWLQQPDTIKARCQGTTDKATTAGPMSTSMPHGQACRYPLKTNM
jgi:hypothetical protein